MAYKRPRKEFEADLSSQQSPYVSYGTPLPPLDPNVRDDGSFVPIWKQDAVDEQGRKRFHGAFTGGYSAGYFNTVGSKEGWTPSTFVSSRSNRHKDAPLQRPEDFMDDEDRAQAAEAHALNTNRAFSALGSTSQDERYKGAFMDLFRPQGDTMGLKLLRSMGWRDGQGIGPKIKRKARLEDTDADEDDDEHLFAPESSRVVLFNRKLDHKGLGYRGEARLAPGKPAESRSGESDSEPESASPALAQPRKPNKSRGAFGVGVLNDDDDADEDEYSMGPRISYNKIIGGDKKSKKQKDKTTTTTANPLLKSKPVFRPTKTLQAKAGPRRCSDGRLPLDGFVLSETMASLDLSGDVKKYAMPLVPGDWQPSTSVVEQADPEQSYQSTADAARASKLDAKSRAAILGETQLPGKSIFDYVTSAARDRIAAATGRNDLPTARGQSMPAGAQKAPESEPELPTVSKRVALGALERGVGGWMPYSEDEAKRQRYRAFLEYHGGVRPDAPSRPAAMEKDKWAQELAEFAHAAEVFKPMSGLMASRFTSASSAPAASTAGQDEDSRQKSADPAEEAARAGMFGPLTRSSHQFYPARLLCKRFNVKLPAHAEEQGEEQPREASSFAASSDVTQQTKDLVSSGNMEQLKREASMQYGTSDGPRSNVRASDGPAEVDASRNDALEGEKPGEAVYKAIFGDEDSD